MKDLKLIQISTDLRKNVDDSDMIMEMRNFDVIVGIDFLENLLKADNVEKICKDTNFVLTINGQKFGRLDKNNEFKLIK